MALLGLLEVIFGILLAWLGAESAQPLPYWPVGTGDRGPGFRMKCWVGRNKNDGDSGGC